MPEVPWLVKWSPFVSAVAALGSMVAAAALAFYAKKQGDSLDAEKARQAQERRDATKAARAAVSFLAFGLARQVKSWMEYFADRGLQVWIGNEPGAKQHLDRAEARVEEMITHANLLPSSERQRVEDAAVLFYTGTQRLLDSDSPGHVDQRQQLVRDAEADLAELIKVLQDHLIIPGYIAREQAILDERPRESVEERLARVIGREMALEAKKSPPKPESGS